MPIEVELPDGTIAEFPDGTSQDVMRQALQARAKQNWKPKQRTPDMLRRQAAEYRDRNPVTNDMNGAQTFMAGVGKSLTDTGRGLNQIYSAAADVVAPQQQTVGGLVSGADNSRLGQATAAVDESRRVDDALMNTGGGIFGNFVGGVGQALVPASAAARAITYTGKGAGLLRAGAAGAAYGGSQPVGEGESRTVNTALGAGLGAAGEKIAPFVGQLGKKAADAIRPEVRAIYEAAKARGIVLTPAQLSDSLLMKNIAAKLKMLPFSGAGKKSADQKAAVNREIAKEIGSDKAVVTPEVYAEVKAAQSAQFNELTARNDLNVTPELVGKLKSAMQDAEIAGPEAVAAVRAAINRLLSQAKKGADGSITVPGRAYQSLDTALGKTTKNGGPLAFHVGEVKTAIREAMDASISPKDREAWNLLRKQYANRKTIRDLVAKGDGGELPPAQLMGRVTANNYGKESMASGTRGGMGDLARIGQRMKDPPTSNSPEGTFALNALNPLHWPALALSSAVGATAGRVANSKGLAALMLRDSRGKPLQGLSRLLEKTQLPKVLPAAGVVIANKRDKNKR